MTFRAGENTIWQNLIFAIHARRFHRQIRRTAKRLREQSDCMGVRCDMQVWEGE